MEKCHLNRYTINSNLLNFCRFFQYYVNTLSLSETKDKKKQKEKEKKRKILKMNKKRGREERIEILRKVFGR